MNSALIDIGYMTDEQKKAVQKNGQIMVSAAAGSGKTSTMVTRIMWQILKGVSLKDMLILVYNNSAADELKERLHKSLFELACKSSGEERKILKEQLDDLPFAHISTIHGFCKSLISENFEKLGLSPSFEILDESGDKIYKNKALDNVFDIYSQNKDNTFFKLCDIFSQARKEDNFKDTLIRLYEMIYIQPDKDEFVKKVLTCYDDFYNNQFVDFLYDDTIQNFAKAKKECEEILPFLINFGQDKYADIIQSLLNLANEIIQSKNYFDIIEIALRDLDLPTVRKKGKDLDVDIFIERAKRVKSYMIDCIKEIKGQFNDLDMLKTAHKQNQEYISKMIELANAFGIELQKLKLKDSVLSFSDLEQKAVELIKLNGEGKGEFKQVYVDEYQDVNPSQEFIISHFVDGECFMVGDIKQSIYGFRLSETTNMLNRINRYKNGEGVALSFNQNFRSGKEILEFVNSIFDVVMTKETADVDYKGEDRFDLSKNQTPSYVEFNLVKNLDKSEKPQKSEIDSIYDIENIEKEEEQEKLEVCEGKLIADKIKMLIGNVKKNDGSFLNYGDIAVLFRSRNTASKRIIETLQNEGIPVEEGSFSKTSVSAENEIILFLKTLDNPKQDIAFAGFLLSYFGGFDEQELAKISTFDGLSFYDKFKRCGESNNQLSPKIIATQKVLNLYRQKASFKNIADLIACIVSDFSYDAYIMKNGESKVYDLIAFVNSTKKSKAKNLSDFLTNLQSLESKNVSSGGDRISVSTFHAYKGLEIPVVFIADLGVHFGDQSVKGDFLVDGKGFIGLNYFDFENKTKSVSMSKFALKKMIKQKESKEEMRLLYVALTRPKQFLFLSSTISNVRLDGFGKYPLLESVKSNLDFISNAIYKGTCTQPIIENKPNISKSEQLKRFVPVFSKSNSDFECVINDAEKFVYPYENATKLSMKYSVSTLDKIDEDAVKIFEESAKIGTLYHKVMEKISYEALGVENVKSELDKMVEQGIILYEDLNLINPNDINRCLNSSIMDVARQSVCEREKAFMMYAPANELSENFDSEDKVLVQGVVDLIIWGEQNIIVDFKNSYLKDGDVLERYRRQLSLYKKAISADSGKTIDKIMLYSFKTGKVIEL